MASKNNINYQLESSPVGLGLRKIDQVVNLSDMTDAGDTTGTLTLTPKLPVGAFVIGTKVTVETPFTGDTSAVLTLGKTSGQDEFTDGSSINVFTAGVKGESAEDPMEFIAAETTIYAVITSATDFSLVTAGKMKIEIFYLSTEEELVNTYTPDFNW